MYDVRFTAEAPADSKALPRNVRNSLPKEIQKWAADPIGRSLALREPLQGWRSYHWRNYRIIFMVLEDLETIIVAAAEKRHPGAQTDVYRQLERLAREGKRAERLLKAFRDITP